MQTLELKLARIGNSRGIRLPADLIRRHGLDDGVVLEDRGDSLVLRPKAKPQKLSWVETAREMAASGQDWTGWDCALADGLKDILREPAPGEHRAPKKTVGKKST
ncbi:MAG: AbrB/MazE/SpoVT family DNA-binding domain-containing protein [Chthoniobacterales bacterium]